MRPSDFKCWLKSQDERIISFQKQLKIQLDSAARWEGKYRIVKHENNELRKKLYGAAKNK